MNVLRETLAEELNKIRYDTISCGALNTLLGTCNQPIISERKDETDPLYSRFQEFQYTKYQPAADELWRVYQASKAELDEQFKNRPERIDEYVQRRYERERNRLKSRIECSLKNLHKAQYKSEGCKCVQPNHNNWHRTAIERQIAQEFGKGIAPVEDHFHYDYHALFTAVDLHNLTSEPFNDYSLGVHYSQPPISSALPPQQPSPSPPLPYHPINDSPPTVGSVQGYQIPNEIKTPPMYHNHYSENPSSPEECEVVNYIPTTKSKTPPYDSRTLRILERWYNNNVQHPYADKQTLANLSLQTGLNQEQIRKWLANRRNRCRNVKRPAEIANWRRQTSRKGSNN
ncbi:unnamed protein product [Dimorphilus gyrociliatus]|uniref:Homeobox domain-containing protein n=1 Tax=Dimorphilus gyrociliatus TaxID=2664684 RepID=A0A7I8VFZ5_9ANNE|nr:unnamed protein product [Dimorphilus gyrociliatus]